MPRMMKIRVLTTTLTEIQDDVSNDEAATKIGAMYSNLLKTVNIPADFIEVEIEPLPGQDKPKLIVSDKYAGPG